MKRSGRLLTAGLNVILAVMIIVVLQCSSVLAASTMLDEAKNILKQNYVDKVPDDVLRAGSIKAMLKLLKDPYAQYYTEKEFEQEMEMLNGSFTGVGFVFNPGKEGAAVINVLPDSPAQKAGIMPDDLLIEAGGHSLCGLNNDQVSEYIRGPVGSKVVLKVKRGERIITFELVRQQIKLPSVQYDMLNQDTALIFLSDFGTNSGEEMEKAIKDLKARKAERWILDMRDNPGGFLDTAYDIAGFFIGKGDTVIVKDRNSEEVHQGELHNEYIDGPVIVLVNENSASAAEIITAALKDGERALIIGHTTYGKGTVQQVFELSDGGRLKFTVAHFYSPLDKPINGIGIKPDIEVSDDNVLKAAELLLRDPPSSYTGSLIRIDIGKFCLTVDPVTVRQREFWPAWSEIIKGCPTYPIYLGNEKNGWTELTAEQRKNGWPLYYPNYDYQGTLDYGTQGIKFDLLNDVKSSYLNSFNIKLINAASGEQIPVDFTNSADKQVNLKPLKTLAAGEYWLVVDNSFLCFNDGHKLDKGLVAKIVVNK